MFWPYNCISSLVLSEPENEEEHEKKKTEKVQSLVVRQAVRACHQRLPHEA